jgi:hypothetical protein
LAGLLFDLDRSQANRWMHRLQPVLEAALGQQLALPKRKLTSMAEFVEVFPEVKQVILDATERPVQRAKAKAKQKENYSGEKKRHTRSHLALVEPSRKILMLSHAYAGRHNDKGILNQEGWPSGYPTKYRYRVTSAFSGYRTRSSMWSYLTKKPRSGQLTAEQKADNRALASERVVCEHSFAGLKRYGITHQVYRNRKEGFDDRSMATAAGPWNFYLKAA